MHFGERCLAGGVEFLGEFGDCGALFEGGFGEGEGVEDLGFTVAVVVAESEPATRLERPFAMN